MAFQSIISHRFQFSYPNLMRASTRGGVGHGSRQRKVSDYPANDMSKKFHETGRGKLKFSGREKNSSAVAFRRQTVAVHLFRHLRPGSMKSAVSSLLRKTREVFVGIDRKAGHGGRRADESTSMEPYFSMPVLPAPTSIVMHV